MQRLLFLSIAVFVFCGITESRIAVFRNLRSPNLASKDEIMRSLSGFKEIDSSDGLPKTFDEVENGVSAEQEDRSEIVLRRLEDELSKAMDHLNGKRSVICTPSPTPLCEFGR